MIFFRYFKLYLYLFYFLAAGLMTLWRIEMCILVLLFGISASVGVIYVHLNSQKPRHYATCLSGRQAFTKVGNVVWRFFQLPVYGAQ